jgi:hypothetical protein
MRACLHACAANKSTFVSKLAELQKYGDPAAQRLREEEERPDAYKALETVSPCWLGLDEILDG